MKKTLSLLILLLSSAIYSQVVELQKLSTGELIESQPLFNKEEDDIYGYFFIFKKDKIAKKEFLYEYVLLDKNLNKVLSGDFTEKLGAYGKLIDVSCIYRDGYISFKIDERFVSIGAIVRTKYRLLDIRENSLSDSFVLTESLEKDYTEESKSIKKSTVFTFRPNSFGYHLNTPLENNGDSGLHNINQMGYATAPSRAKGIQFFNAQLNPLWSYSYNASGEKKQYEAVSFLNNTNHSDVLIGRRYFHGSKNEDLLKKGQLFNSFLFFDKETGKLISEIAPYGLKKAAGIQAKDISTIDVYLNSNEKVSFLDRIMSEDTKTFLLDEKKIIGFSKSEYEIATGKELNRNFFKWTQLAPHLSINEHGYINEKGEPNSYLFLHDARLKSNGNLVFVTEQYKTLSGNAFMNGMEGVKIFDMILFEVDKNMNLLQYKRIDKGTKSVRNGVKMQGTIANYFSVFDYSGYQDLGDDNFLFFYFNKQKPESGGKKQWVLGIVSNIDGSFTEQKINLKSKDGSELSIQPAKKGYIMIVENIGKTSEIRLEKIN
ncbi:DUF6770 family protein [Flavobacterium sp. NKUCC04_CG]|uniref:DUF6770 family protein n=1 Tax=Flavobacterium sp. NKUCC04_CG TaxID=2842121 RepID=UPI001C5AB15F|nr:DUF6770 family protein [Flavobacterium sp. NKUCC04_CG]MBW3520409.1 hypothetical protein [Flavobacterium sp. NKUCC04_CG]